MYMVIHHNESSPVEFEENVWYILCLYFKRYAQLSVRIVHLDDNDF